MRFNQIIHPEVITAKRGGCKEYPFILDMVHFSTEDGFTFDPKLMENMPSGGVADRLCSMKRFLMDGAKCYHINKDFLQAISKVQKDIPFGNLPHRFSAYISFSKDVLEDKHGFVQGAYVFVGPAKETTSLVRENSQIKLDVYDQIVDTEQKVLWICYLNNGEDSF